MKDEGSCFATKLASIVAAVLATATLALSWLRLFYGVDFTDESFYVALAHRFALGDLPVRDEQNLTQFAGFMVAPFVKLFLWLTGGTEGIVLFMRHLHLAFTAAVGVVVFGAARAALPWREALLTAAVCLVFVPFNIHGVSYNTLGSGLLTVGCFLLLRAPQASSPRAMHAVSGAVHSLMALAYPPLAPLVAIFLFLIATDTAGGRRMAVAYLAGALTAALIPAWMLLQVSWPDLLELRTYLAGFQGEHGGGLDKWFAIVRGYSTQTPYLPYVLASAALLAVWHRYRPSPLRYLLPFMPLLLGLYSIGANGTTSLYFIVVVAVLGPFVYPFVGSEPFARRLMRVVWVPSFIAGIVTSWSSSNASQNGCIGMFPAALASILFMQLALRRLPVTPRRFAVGGSLLALLVPLLVIVPLLRGGYADYYGEPVQRSQLTHRVQGGPFHGLLTTPGKQVFLERFSRASKPLIRPDDRVMVFNEWPAGYLLAGVRPGVNSVWLPTAPLWVQVNRSATLNYWKRHGNEPTLVFLMKQSQFKADVLLDYVTQPNFEELAVVGPVTVLRRMTAP
jgi:hypothetical protein